MYLIKACPSCNKRIRFPIDRGRIKVNCSCGYSFLADPDDKSLYNNAEFDVKPSNSKKNPVNKKSHNIKYFIHEFIEKLFSFKYKIQNFRLLPSEEKIKIIIAFFLILIILIVGIYMLIHKSSANLDNNNLVI